MQLSICLWVGVAGALGALCRYGLHAFFVRLWPGAGLPVGTLCVNVLGCLAFGLVVGALVAPASAMPSGGDAVAGPNVLRLALLVGFLGAFTTFSTFAFEGVELLREARYGLFTLHLAAHNGLGLLAVFLGLFASRALGGGGGA